MKYQQLENLEAGWKWGYLAKKQKEGFAITRYVDSSEINAAVKALFAMEHKPIEVLAWIKEHINLELEIKLKQAIRAKRKRYYNAEQDCTRKKSIDLDFPVWKKLSDQAKKLDATLSDTIEYLISDADLHALSKPKDETAVTVQAFALVDLPAKKPKPVQSSSAQSQQSALLAQSLEQKVLEKLDEKSKEMNISLSQTLDYLLKEEERARISSLQFDSLKQDLSDLLDP